MEYITDNNLCTGCSVCQCICPAKAISMQEDKSGFFKPVIDNTKCINCEKCKKTCPANFNDVQSCKSTYYAAQNEDLNTRDLCSSGGIFPLLTDYVLRLNGYIAGAVYDANHEVRHIVTNDKNLIKKIYGAKYSQSEIGTLFKEIKALLSKDEYVLMSGTPCQISALRRYLGREYDKLITVDIVCNSIPSRKAWREYLKFRAQFDKQTLLNIAEINLRSKSTGWTDYSYNTEFHYKNGNITHLKASNDPFIQFFVKGYISNKACENCKYKGTRGESDITLGDCWGIWKSIPDFDDNKGTSIIIVHTDKGKMIWESVSKMADFKEYQEEDAILYNPSIINNNIVKDDALKNITEKDFRFFVRRQRSKRRISLLKNTAKNTIRRIKNIK